jgi:hypothetical protein
MLVQVRSCYFRLNLLRLSKIILGQGRSGYVWLVEVRSS